MNDTHIDLVKGWVNSPNHRGTIDIIWSCASTIFVCVWVMLHLNLPAETDSDITIFLRKTKWFMMAMLAPELLMLFAGGQWAAARRSVDDMKALGADQWGMIHGFHAESGGFVLEAKDSPRFPVTAKQLHYLAQRGYIEVPTISADEIFDKSKADVFAKLIAGAQSGWFAVQIIARGMENLAVTLLELSTICLMTCTGAALFFWFYKPLDVRVPTTVYCDRTISEILVEAGEAAKHPYQDTPLDFCESVTYTSTQFPYNELWGEQKRPLPRIPNDRDSLLHSWKIVVVISIPTAAFGALQLIAWNFHFPTRAEQLLWRYTCLAGGAVLGLGCISEATAIVVSNYTLSGMRTFNDYKTRWPWCIVFYGAGAMYFVARVIVIVEVVISMRLLPASCFETVDWTSIFPHV